MENYFEAQVSYIEEGAEKTTKKNYLIQGVSFTESETHLTTYLTELETVQRFTINSMKRISYDDTVSDNLDIDYQWFEIMVKIKVDESKEAPYKYLVASSTAEEAIRLINYFLQDTDGVFRIVSVKEKIIADIVLFKKCCDECDTCHSNYRVLSFDRQKGFELTFEEMDKAKKEAMEGLGAFEMGVNKYKVEATEEKLKEYAIGKVLAGHVRKDYQEEFIDEETGESITKNRSEVLIPRGTLIQAKEVDIILSEGVEYVSLYL